jgi:hypothetical protein
MKPVVTQHIPGYGTVTGNSDEVEQIAQLHSAPIEAGWEATRAALPDLSAEASAMLRFMFFAGARHYREMIKTLFEQEDNGETLCQTLHDVAAEIQHWEREEPTPASLMRGKRT